MKGPAPKPTALRELQGNPGHRPFNADEPKPPASATLDAPPPELRGNAVARSEWTRIAPVLRLVRVLTDADRSALAALCLEWSRYIAATRHIAAHGMVINAPSGYPMVSPWLSIATKALAGCNRLWPEFGLTPSSRSRVSASDAPPDDAFAEFDRTAEPVN